MEERERIVREIIKVLPEVAKTLNRNVAAHVLAMQEVAQAAAASTHAATAGSSAASQAPAAVLPTASAAASAPVTSAPGPAPVPAGPLPAGPPPAVSGAQLRTLIHLAQYGAQTMGELAEGMQITMASATGLIKPLVAMGYVSRSRDPRDRRVVRVGLNSRAQEMADLILAERRREVEAALAGMDDRACRGFLEGLERLVGRQR